MFEAGAEVARFTAHMNLQVAEEMKTISHFFILLIVLSLASCDNRKGHNIIPMSALLSDPDRIIGKQVVVVGFLGRGQDLYLTKDHSEINDRSSSLFLNLPDRDRRFLIENCQNEYVEVVGTYDFVEIKGAVNRLGIVDIELIQNQLTGKNCLQAN